MTTTSASSLTSSSRQNEKACDQCNRSHIRCNREYPVCQTCARRQQPCTWDREPIFRTNHLYQNIETFSLELSKSQFQLAKFRPPQKHRQRRRRPKIALPLDPSWQLTLRKWIHSSHARIFFNYFVKISGIPLARATNQERRFLAELLLNKIGIMSIEKKMVLQLDYGLGDGMGVLNLAKEAFFHYFNPFFTLFTRHGYDSYPRSWLLKLTIWRIGLQFFPDSSVNRVLIEHIDSQLIEATRPSCLVTNLDTLQSYLLIIFGLIYSRALQRLWIFSNTVVSLVYALGLHRHSPTYLTDNNQLERMLAYRVVVLLDVTCVYTLGLPSQFIKEVAPDCTIPLTTTTYYFHSLNLSLNQSVGFQYGNLWALSPTPAMDLSLLISNECICRQLKILARINFEFQDSIHSGGSAQPLINCIYSTVGQLRKLFHRHINQLRQLRANFKERAQFQNQIRIQNQNQNSTSTTPPINFCLPLQAFDQMICFLAIQYHYSQLLVLGIAAHIDPSGEAAPLLIRPLTNHVAPFITSGLLSALKLIRLISRIGPDPFTIMKICYLSTAAHFIIRHYHAYTDTLHPPSPSSSPPGIINPTLLTSTLREARSLIAHSQSTLIFSYQASSNIVLFDALLAHHDVKL